MYKSQVDVSEGWQKLELGGRGKEGEKRGVGELRERLRERGMVKEMERFNRY